MLSWGVMKCHRRDGAIFEARHMVTFSISLRHTISIEGQMICGVVLPAYVTSSLSSPSFPPSLLFSSLLSSFPVFLPLFFCCLFLFLSTGSYLAQTAFNGLCNWGWSWTCDPPFSTFWTLELQACNTTLHVCIAGDIAPGLWFADLFAPPAELSPVPTPRLPHWKASFLSCSLWMCVISLVPRSTIRS